MSPSDALEVEQTHHAEELESLLDAVKPLILQHVRAADTSKPQSRSGLSSSSRPVLVDSQDPGQLSKTLSLALPEDGSGTGQDGLVQLVKQVLDNSVNTWDQGFLDKLYSSTNPVGVISELLLSILNTNVHVYQVSPALTLIEKYTCRRLAALFDFTSPYSGGIAQPGGSAGNSSSIVIARNTLYPETKTRGLAGKEFRLFTSSHGHYSVEKAAQVCGFGSDSVISVPVDEAGRMRVDELDRLILESKGRGEVPFYVNATAGTTVMGSFDPLNAIADTCEQHGLWMHVDGSWGGGVAFNKDIRKGRLDGVGRADSVVICAHKMLEVPLTSSFLLGKDIRQFWKAMTLPAGYLFHNDATDDDNFDINDLADLTPQCGRKGDALKLYTAWTYYGSRGLSNRVANAFDRAEQLFTLLEKEKDFKLVSRRPLPCLQVCFYYSPDGLSDAARMSRRTEEMTRRLIRRGWMIDYAPGESGKFFRVVVNLQTLGTTVIGLVGTLREVGEEVVKAGL